MIPLAAKIPDIASLIAAGFDPKTGLPLKIVGSQGCILKENIRKNIRIMDEQNAVNRFFWHNLPSGLTGQLLERVLYYKGQGVFFYMDTMNKFFFLPYALDGTIDCYGRFMGITPLPFMGGTTAANDEEKPKKIKPWITGLQKSPIYEPVIPENLTAEIFKNGCVLLHDYTPQISQTVIARQILQEPIIDVMSDCVAFMRTALLNNTGVQGIRVGSEDEQSNVDAASQSLDTAAKIGKKWIPIVGSIEFQELTGNGGLRSEEFLLALQSLDNLRLSMLGLDSGGLFQKKAHMLQDEQNMNAGNAGLIMQDGLTLRLRFADIVNSIWGLGIYPEISETILNIDKDMDGDMQDNEDEEPIEEGEENVIDE